MIDFDEIAKQYAKENGFDIVCPCIKHNGNMYFYFNYTVRPRYLGHPHVVKISNKGKIEQVLEFHEIYWAVNLAKEPLKLL